MTFAEIKEMINSTITENGERQITGRALNLALTETVNQAESVQQAQEDFQNTTFPAFEEMILAKIEEALANGSGSGAEIIKLGAMDSATEALVQTEAEMAWNAEVYNKCKTAAETGQPLPPIQLDALGMMSADFPEGTDTSGAAMTATAIQVIFILPGSSLESLVNMSGLMIMALTGNMLSVIVSENGAATLMQ